MKLRTLVLVSAEIEKDITFYDADSKEPFLQSLENARTILLDNQEEEIESAYDTLLADILQLKLIANDAILRKYIPNPMDIYRIDTETESGFINEQKFGTYSGHQFLTNDFHSKNQNTLATYVAVSRMLGDLEG